MSTTMVHSSGTLLSASPPLIRPRLIDGRSNSSEDSRENGKVSIRRNTSMAFSTALSPSHGVEPCARPVLMMQDLGATFGPKKVSLTGWKQSPIWRDAQGCTVSMKHLPYEGATFAEVEISEGGRALLASKLATLDRETLTRLLRTAHFPDAQSGRPGAEDVSPWVDVLQQKIAEITTRSCAPSPSR